MPTPYNLDIHHSCQTCPVRKERPFCNLSDKTVATLDAIKFTSVYPKGSLLFVEGEKPRGVFVVCTGKVKLTTSSAEGKTLIVKVAQAGEILGVSAAVTNTPYQISAETAEPAQVNFIKREDFLLLMTQERDAAMHIAHQLSEDYHAAQREIRSLGLSQTTGEKLARLVLDWCDAEGEQTQKGIRLKVLLTHEEIAQMIGSTRETVTRLLTQLKSRKLIEMKGSTMFVGSRAALEQMITI